MALVEPIREGPWAIVAVVRGGRCLFMDFLDSIGQQPDRNRILSLLDYVSQVGPRSLGDKSEPLRDKIFELRPTKQIRVLYFYDDGERHRIVLTHGVVKKQDKMYPPEIDKAIDLRNRYATARRANKESM